MFRQFISHLEMSKLIYQISLEKVDEELEEKLYLAEKLADIEVVKYLPKLKQSFIMAILSLKMYYLDLGRPDLSYYVKDNMFEGDKKDLETLREYTQLVWKSDYKRQYYQTSLGRIIERVLKDNLGKDADHFFDKWNEGDHLKTEVEYVLSAVIFYFYDKYLSKLNEEYVIKFPEDYQD